MKFSICIPNYNYANYLDKTLRSVLDQDHTDFEILVSDNASTDTSVQVVESFADPRIQVQINPCNVGFAGNLDRAGGMASGERMILLSSDDVMEEGALSTYQRLLNSLPDGGGQSILSSAQLAIDSDGNTTGRMDLYGPPFILPSERAPELEEAAGAAVYRVAAADLLKRCLLAMRNPFYFATACYPREIYDAVGGYGGGRLINPDKWFHWRLLAKAKWAYYIDRPLFAYRWHASNQTSQQSTIGALKYLVDEYASTLELDGSVLAQLGLTREQFQEAYVEYDIARHGLSTLATGGRLRARRILDFGRAVYPQHWRRNRRVHALRTLLALGPLGQILAARAYRSYRAKTGPTQPE